MLETNALVQMAESRKHDDYLIEEWSNRRASFQSRNDRILTVRAMSRGDWRTVFPDESSKSDFPKVQNVLNDALQDMGDLAAETTAAIRCEPDAMGTKAKDAAHLRQSVFGTYGIANSWELMVPQLAMDFISTGGFFICAYPRKGNIYPRWDRFDPINCYPNFSGDTLIDLLVVTRKKLRQVAWEYPELGLVVPPDSKDEADIIDFYGENQVAKLVCTYTKPRYARKVIPRGYAVYNRANPLGRPPIAWAKRPTADGEFRGLLDQLPGILNAQNRIVELMLESADQATSTPLLASADVENIENFGPGAILIKKLPDDTVERILPAQISPHLFAVLSMLEAGAHASGAYPASRQGDVSQSIASAAFVQATMGRLTSVVRATQRSLAEARRQLHKISGSIDEQWLNVDKPLLMPAGNVRSYIPKEALAGNYESKVVYGAFSGLDIINRHTMLAQDLGSEIISKETMLENLDYIPDAKTELQKRQGEDLLRVHMAKILGDPSYPTGQLVMMVDKGIPILKAIAQIEEQQQAALQAQQQVAQPGQPALPGPMQPGEAAQQALSLQKGGVPGTAEQLPPPDLPPLPPLSDILPSPRTQVFVG